MFSLSKRAVYIGTVFAVGLPLQIWDYKRTFEQNNRVLNHIEDKADIVLQRSARTISGIFDAKDGTGENVFMDTEASANADTLQEAEQAQAKAGLSIGVAFLDLDFK